MNNSTTMICKKKGFFTFLFSLFPGCGEMYLGFFKQGTCMMLSAFVLIAISVGLDFGIPMLFFPVLWFYSFCHVHNMVALPDEEFYAIEDTYLFIETGSSISNVWGKTNTRKVIGTILIVLGIASLWNTLEYFLRDLLSDYNIWNYLSPFFHVFPQFIIGVIIVILGILLIKGKKKELDFSNTTPAISSKEN